MTTPTRQQVLNANAAIRRGNARRPTRLPDGEVTFRIPDADWPVLMIARPDLKHPDNAIRMAAWNDLRHDPLGEKYLVVRTPTK
jgi:hypothetical protein